MDKDLLAAYGIDYDRGLKNCMGNADFYKKILSMFLADSCFSRAEEALESRDNKTLFSLMHELKGVSGNAALTALYGATVPLVELLRRGTDDGAQVESLFHEVRGAYGKACEGIRHIISEV